MPERRFSANNSYRYGFNGKENDTEVKGDGTQQDYGMRVYDPRLGKFLSVDPLTKDYPWYTPYQFAGNTPIQAIDEDGLEPASTPTQKIEPFRIMNAAESTCPGPCGAIKQQAIQAIQNREASKYPNIRIPVATMRADTRTSKERQRDAALAEILNSMRSKDGETPRISDDFPIVGTGVKALRQAFNGNWEGAAKSTAKFSFETALVSAPLIKAASTQTFFRAMSTGEYATLETTKGLTSIGGKELFVSTSESYARSYLGRPGYDVLVKFETKPNTLNMLSNIGVRNGASSVIDAGYSGLPKVSSGWMQNGFNFFKGERNVLNVGLGQNPSIFNQNILNFKAIK